MNFKLTKSFWFTFTGVILGAVGGYLYYHYIGCLSGTCSITSKPINSTLYGSLIGGLFFNLFVPHKGKNENKPH
jgi:phage shock protein E